MSVTVAEVADFERLVTFTIPGAEVVAAENAAARRISRELRIPGFRPGRAPRPIVEANVGADRIRSEAIDDLLPRVVGRVLDEAGVDAAATPSVDAIRDVDGGLEVDVRVVVWPALASVPDYVGRRIEVGSAEVTDDEVEEQLRSIREQFADIPESDGPAEVGDVVVLTLTGTKDGEPFEALAADDLFYEVGSGLLVDGLDDHLPGVEPGGQLSFDGVLPDGFGDLAGEPVTFHVTAKEVRRKVLPELTDEWAAENTEFESVAEFASTLRRRLGQRKVDAAYERFRRAVLDTLAGEIGLELPEPLVRGEMDRIFHDFSHRLEEQGIAIADYLEVTGQGEEQFVADLEAQARRSIGVDLVLDAVVDDAGIDLEDDERDGALDAFRALAAEQGVEVAGSPQEQRVLTDMLRHKAMETLLKSAVPVDEAGEVVDFVALATAVAEPDDEEPAGDSPDATPAVLEDEDDDETDGADDEGR